MDNVLAEGVIEHDALMINNVLLTGTAGQAVADNGFVKNCIFLAQHGADKVARSETQPGPWFDHYAGMFWSMDWTLAEPVEYIKPQFSGSLKQAWLKVARPYLTSAQIAQIESVLGKLENDAELLAKIAGLSGKVFGFNIVPVSYKPNGDLEMVVSHIRLIKLGITTPYLFWTIDQSRSQLDIRIRRLEIKRRDMDAIRQRVEEATRALALKFSEYEL
ncbi:hypothetical protein PSH97_02885 [Pseudomonas cucumis]|uniref:Uncharacterized protein n=1 Tax=Pseudomonas cucumis TaxID=2954082 RepID=A0ABY9EYT2_9PSED|nr:hypothetical protein [Pseudomonas cucumis]WLG85495.1 hypothetical protein PSH97_02885 [Pseudomonas cucumis]